MSAGGGIQKTELVEQLLRKSVTGKLIRIPFEQDIMLARMHVAGTDYYGAKNAAESFSAGDRFVLRREPENRHDKFAIEVLTQDGGKLGYIPRDRNEIPARLMDAGKHLFVQLETFKLRGSWLDISISLYMEDI